MHCQGISQFYLHTLHFIHKWNEPYLPLPSQLQLVLIYLPQTDGRLSRPWCKVLYHTATTATCLLYIGCLHASNFSQNFVHTDNTHYAAYLKSAVLGMHCAYYSRDFMVNHFLLQRLSLC